MYARYVRDAPSVRRRCSRPAWAHDDSCDDGDGDDGDDDTIDAFSAERLGDASQMNRLALFADYVRVEGVDGFERDAAFMDRYFHATFGSALSLTHALRRLYPSEELTTSDGAFKIIVLGATDAHEYARWRTFGVLGCFLSRAIEIVLVGPALTSDGETFSCDIPFTNNSVSGAVGARLSVRTRRGTFPKDNDDFHESDLFVAFNAGLPVGFDWSDAIEAIVGYHLEGKCARVGRRTHPPGLWVSDVNAEATRCAFEMLQIVVDRRLSDVRHADPEFIEPYLNPHRSPVFRPASGTCALPSCSNAFAFAFRGLAKQV